MIVFVRTALIGAMMLLPALARADCEIDATGLYASFKQYREQVNSATTLEQLTPYFSSAFNHYYTTKLENPESEESRTRYLTQYWDNLNAAKDIAIVYDYGLSDNGLSDNGLSCAKADKKPADTAILSLLAILDQPTAESKVDLWRVKIHYVNEAQQWLIDSMEYTKSRSQRMFDESQIIDNFVWIR